MGYAKILLKIPVLISGMHDMISRSPDGAVTRALILTRSVKVASITMETEFYVSLEKLMKVFVILIAYKMQSRIVLVNVLTKPQLQHLQLLQYQQQRPSLQLQ